MLRSLFTGISGLSAHQQMLDVTANNIANVNTTGFKGSRSAFQDTLSQTVQGAAAANAAAGTGGTNAQQIGLGVKLAGTEMNMGQGSNQATGVGTDLMLTGDGFFVVSKNGANSFTRSGAFHIDNSGNLVTADGAQVMGYNNGAIGSAFSPNPATDTPAPINLSAILNGANYGGTDHTFVSYSIGSDGMVTAIDDDGTPQNIAQLAVANFANPNGLEKVGNTQFTQSAGSGAPQIGLANDGTHGAVAAGYLEMSNVDLSAELTNLIISERGFQANAKTITTSDEVLQTLVNLKR